MSGNRLFALAIIALLLASLAACGQSSGRAQNDGSIRSQQELAIIPPSNGPLPDVFELDGLISVNREVSADSTVASNGADAQTGTNGTSGLNVEINELTLTLRAYEPGEYAYGVFGQAVGTTYDPASTIIECSPCKLGGGRDDEIPLSYYIGVADYTMGAWRWFGPFGQEDASVMVNGGEMLDRYKSPADNCYICVLASNGSKATSALPVEGSIAGFPLGMNARRVSQDVEDPGGLTIERVVTTIKEGLTTLPSIINGLQATTDTSGVNLSWDATTDANVDFYKVFRDDLDLPDAPMLLQDVPIPTVTYTDTAGTPGKNYRYILQAHNSTGLGGSSLRNASRLIVSPIATASDDLTDRITVSWPASNGATGYSVLRADDISGTPISIGQTDAATLSYDDTEPMPGVTKWYWIQALGEDVDSTLGTPDSGVITIVVGNWHTLTVDSTNDVGRTNSLRVVNGNPAISYYDSTNKDLKYVRATTPDGSAWESPITVYSANDVGWQSRLQIVNGYPAICCEDTTAKDVIYMQATDVNGASWGTVESLDGGGAAGRPQALEIVNGNPAVAYHRSVVDGDVMFVRASDADGSTWGSPVIADEAYDVGFYSSMSVVNGFPAIAYSDVTNGDMKYVRASNANGSTWGTPKVFHLAASGIGRFPSLQVINGNPAISYYDFTLNDLRYTRASDVDGTDNWGLDMIVDSNGDAGQNSSLGLVGRYPAISYCEFGSGYLMYIRALNAEGSSWDAPEEVDNTGGVGLFSCIEIVNGNPAISYWDYTNKDLKYAYFGP